MSSHHEHSIYRLNSGAESLQTALPLPPKEGLTGIRINAYDDVPEPEFDPEIHLNLQRPKFVRLFPDFRKCSDFPVNKNKGENSSPLAWSSPFQVIKYCRISSPHCRYLFPGLE